MYKYVLLCILAVLIMSCGESEQPVPTAYKEDVVTNATRVWEERYYFVTLKFKKEDLLNPWSYENEYKAERRTILVGEQAYNDYEIGEVLSTESNEWGFFTGDLFIEYVISVEEKEMEAEHFWQDETGERMPILPRVYRAATEELIATKETLQVPFDGSTILYVLEKPLSEYEFVSEEPLMRYFITVEIANETATLDPFKHIRNNATVHEITLEVPKSVYEQEGEVWDPKISMGSFILNGRLSTLHGRILDRRSEIDPNFVVKTTADGQIMIIPN